VKPDKIDKTDINEELKSLNKVSQFKKSMVDRDDEDKHPMEKINDIIKSSKSDIETGIIENISEKDVLIKSVDDDKRLDEVQVDDFKEVSKEIVEDTIDKVLNKIDDKGKKD
jgi:hypothetical protein